MSDHRGDSDVVPAEAPTSHDYLLAVLPAPVVAGVVAGYVSSLSLIAGVAVGSTVASAMVAHGLFVDPPEGL